MPPDTKGQRLNGPLRLGWSPRGLQMYETLLAGEPRVETGIIGAGAYYHDMKSLVGKSCLKEAGLSAMPVSDR